MVGLSEMCTTVRPLPSSGAGGSDGLTAEALLLALEARLAGMQASLAQVTGSECRVVRNQRLAGGLHASRSGGPAPPSQPVPCITHSRLRLLRAWKLAAVWMCGVAHLHTRPRLLLLRHALHAGQRACS